MEKQPLTMVEQRLADTISDVASELTNLEQSRAQIYEDFFVKVFLKMFAGEPAFVEKVKPEMWFGISRGPFNEVDIIDAQGQILYSVPAYYSQQAITPLDGTGKAAKMQTVTDMVRTVNQHAMRGPGVADSILLQELDRRSFMFHPDADTSGDAKRWADIFARYGIKPAHSVEPTLKLPATNANNDQDTEYDILP